MNFLAHAHLSDRDPESLLGNLVADFVKGRVDDHDLPPRVRRGVRLHRAVDEFVDTHPGWLSVKRLLSPERRRFAGPLVDMFYDHLLARHWAHYSDEPLDAFVAEVYAALRGAEAPLPERAERVFGMMAEQDWLQSYAHLQTLGHAINGMSRRSPRVAAMAGALEDLDANYAAIESQFHTFYPALRTFAEAWQHRHPIDVPHVS